MKPATIVFLDGRFVRAADARVSALDRGFLYGDGVFDTVRTYAGEPFALDAHLRRLRETARRIGLTFVASNADVARWIRELCRRNGLERVDVAARLTVTRGVGGDLVPPDRATPTVLLTARTLDPSVEPLRRRGVRVLVLPFHPGIGGFLSGRKTIDYLTAAIGKSIARRRRAFEGLYSTPGGEILEGTTSNVFVVRRGRLATPPTAAGVLPGVTRGLVLRLARQAGIEAVERRISRTDLENADEAFLTASTIEIMPVRQVGRTWFRPVPGPVTARLQKGFAGLHP